MKAHPLNTPGFVVFASREKRSVGHPCSLIINPAAGGYSERKLRETASAFEAAGFSPEVLITQGAGDAVSFARRICREREEPLIIIGGGDGTINEVLNGVEPGQATLAVLPLGTANVLARELGIRSAEDAIARIIRKAARPLTVGLLETGSSMRRFLLMAGIGIDGAIVAGVRDGEKRHLGKWAYLLAALRQMRDWDRKRLKATVDGKQIECHSIVVCNAARYGGDFLLAPGADLFTPDFRVVCVMGDTRRTYMKLVSTVIAGKMADNDDVTLLSAREVEVAGDKAVQVDGDYCCCAPVRITAQTNFARLIV
jgi:YegS/Rv2252/BmrU family lipid kinase